MTIGGLSADCVCSVLLREGLHSYTSSRAANGIVAGQTSSIAAAQLVWTLALAGKVDGEAVTRECDVTRREQCNDKSRGHDTANLKRKEGRQAARLS